ncbi:hypothetical protein [Pleurocapsa sp. FMAR1]|uniref:hypothetical protein n=1 Tax=Pleurocapsa sp. FMAR1 TaxID=3040204 RepID=UPI0029C6689F|nr:hypothetical protein [Pleurocapsa sp. FMAR1]
MTPIESPYDVRLVTLIGLAINAVETLALEQDRDPETIIAELLYVTNKRLHETGEKDYLRKLSSHYSILSEAIY